MHLTANPTNALIDCSGLWIDSPDCMTQLRDRAGNDVLLQRIGRDLIEIGFSIIPDIQSMADVERTNRDYDQWLRDNAQQAEENQDEVGRQFRLANFHMASDAAMRLAKNAEIMRVLDFIFGREAAVHTSLTFQYSTMQQLHRDAPYFHTFPESQYVGVWTALEDVDPAAGPLSYIPGSHRFRVDQHAYYREAMEQYGDPAVAKGAALWRYQNEIMTQGEAIGERAYALLKAGDVAIWHPQLVHGGSYAARAELTRRSMVVHCCPRDTHVYVDDIFVSHDDQAPPPTYYAQAESLGRAHSDFRTPGFMPSI